MTGFKRLTDAVTQLCYFVDEVYALKAILAIRKHTRFWSPSRTPLFAGKHHCREVVAMYFDKNSIEYQAFYQFIKYIPNIPEYRERDFWE